MKKSILILLLSVCIVGYGQNRTDEKPKTLMNNNGIKGGFVSLSSLAYEINNQLGYGIGGEVAAVFGRKFNLGFSAYGLITDVETPPIGSSGQNYYYEMAYGGLFIEPMLKSKWPVHLSFPITLGAGGVAAVQDRFYEPYWDTPQAYDYDLFLIAQGGVNIELNVFSFMRLAGGINYRNSSPFYFDQQKLDLDGLGANISLKLGWF
jgi:hypothetical protein